MDPQVVFPAMLAVMGDFLLLPVALYALLDARRPRVMRCPHGGEPVQLRLTPGHLAASALVGSRQRVRGCTRWPAQTGCDRACELTVV